MKRAGEHTFLTCIFKTHRIIVPLLSICRMRIKPSVVNWKQPQKR